MGVLYKLTFSNGKAYIGITRRSFAERFRDHKKRAQYPREKEKFAVHKAWQKYGEPIAEILKIAPNEDLPALEAQAIALFSTRAPHGYNLTDGGEGCPGHAVTDVTREKLRQLNLGKKQSAETIKKRSAAMKGRECSPETRRKIGEKNKINSLGKSPSESTRALLSEKSKGRTHSVPDAAKEKMRAAKLGKKQSAESIEKRRVAMMGRTHSAETIAKLKIAHTGKTISESAKEKMRAAKVGKPWSAARRAAYEARAVCSI